MNTIPPDKAMWKRGYSILIQNVGFIQHLVEYNTAEYTLVVQAKYSTTHVEHIDYMKNTCRIHWLYIYTNWLHEIWTTGNMSMKSELWKSVYAESAYNNCYLQQ